jgi:hypothetical protein
MLMLYSIWTQDIEPCSCVDLVFTKDACQKTFAVLATLACLFLLVICVWLIFGGCLIF